MTNRNNSPQLPEERSFKLAEGLQRPTSKPVHSLCSAVKKTVLALEPESEILLYGSRARGQAGPDADWDFLILVDGPAGHQRKKAIRHRLYDLELEYGTVLSSLIFSRELWNSPLYKAMSLHQNVERDGISL